MFNIIIHIIQNFINLMRIQ